LEKVWMGCVQTSQTPARRTILWKEFTSMIASGRLMSMFAEAEDVLKKLDHKSHPLWVSNGGQYSRWLGLNISTMLKGLKFGDTDGWSAAQKICSKALALGYSGTA
jgi:telomere length regulation protein